LSTCLLLGCRGFDAKAPVGFAAFADRRQFRAVSSDGVTYRVHRDANSPKADLAFWREALKKRMIDAGYIFVSDAEIKARAEPGYWLELAAPVGAQDYTYAVAIFVRGSHIVIAESAGEVAKFRKHKDEILAAVTALEL
jgi:hypothetical protein